MFKTLSLEARLFELFINVFVVAFVVVLMFVVVFAVVFVSMLVVVSVVLLFVCKFQVTDKLLLENELLTVLTEILRCIVFGRMLLDMLSVILE